MKKKKYYVVWEGIEPGVYNSWSGCRKQILGYPSAKYKSFKTEKEAQEAYYDGVAGDFIGKIKKRRLLVISEEDKKDIVWNSISVDAACSGNPGKMEYQGVDSKTGFAYFHQQFNLGTNNVGEFLAIVHALAMLNKKEGNTAIYSDSKIAMGWVKAKKCRTKLKRSSQTAVLYQLIKRAEKWLQNNTYTNPILKWETKKWGEIPADFGRK